MSGSPTTGQADGTFSKPRGFRKQLAIICAALLAGYVCVAYLVLPRAWEGFERRHPALDEVPGITETADGIPGDPLNVALIGSESDLKAALADAGWFPADPLSLRSDLEITEAAVLSRPDVEAPVSNLYLWGRKEDLAFEQPVGDNPRHRNHVRFWKAATLDSDGRPLWIGSATYDERVGFSDTTGQITHHIAPNVDDERDHLFDDLKRTGGLTNVVTIPDFHKVRSGRNGGGDPWQTDGELYVGTLGSHEQKAR